MIRRDYGPAGACQRKAAVLLLLLLLLSVIAAVVWGGYELVSSLAAAAVVPAGLPAPVTHRARRGVPALADEVRHVLLQVLRRDALDGWQAGESMRELRRREWHLVACGFGDLVDGMAQLAAVVVVSVLVLGGGLAVAVFAPWWVRLVVTLAVAGALAAGHRLRVAVGRLEAMVDEEVPR